LPTNIEWKARARDFAIQRRRAEELARAADPAAEPLLIEQTDVFFHVPHGRLKLRIFADGTGELIPYQRSDDPDAKASHYQRVPVPDPPALRSALAGALGERCVVRKKRWLSLVGQTRIHLDEVDGLGLFLEVEVVLSDGQSQEEGRLLAEQFRLDLGVEPEDLVKVAYADLLEK
jgi:adenylate cyclase class IV